MGAHAFVVPLRVASGIRVRILEALAYQIPVVTTSIGCEGLAVENERHLVMADSVEEMSEAVIRLVKEPRLRQTLQREGRRLVEKSYSLTAAENSLERLYRKTADGVLAGKTT
jgi:glycosyltransferase involved in cell wall biosynthesis